MAKMQSNRSQKSRDSLGQDHKSNNSSSLSTKLRALKIKKMSRHRKRRNLMIRSQGTPKLKTN